MKNSSLLNELNVLKGLAIIMVVLVHVCSPFQYVAVERLIMSFKSFMYLFMFVSGFLFQYSGWKISSVSEYLLFVSKKIKRLLIPYFTVSIMIVITKYITGYFSQLKNPVDHNVWKDLFLSPMGGVTTHLWFVYVLFIIFLIFPIIRLINNSILASLTVILIYFIEVIHIPYFELQLVKFYLLFFYLGYMFSKLNIKDLNKHAGSLCFISAVFFIVVFAGKRLIDNNLSMYLPDYHTKNIFDLLQGLSCILFFYYLSVVITKRQNALFNLLNFFGVYSYVIYLLHTLFMGAVCVVMRPYLQMRENGFTVVLLVFVGIFSPIVVSKYIISRSRLLSMLILGAVKPK